ncbi:hypothetical protein DFJ74DRAFT_381681 [Hyaloraphidium curvatum]|nr:hypothetical protein DFJ74DRAFT_381681 [Hyaloraphidium curvatum]
MSRRASQHQKALQEAAAESSGVPSSAAATRTRPSPATPPAPLSTPADGFQAVQTFEETLREVIGPENAEFRLVKGPSRLPLLVALPPAFSAEEHVRERAEKRKQNLLASLAGTAGRGGERTAGADVASRPATLASLTDEILLLVGGMLLASGRRDSLLRFSLTCKALRRVSLALLAFGSGEDRGDREAEDEDARSELFLHGLMLHPIPAQPAFTFPDDVTIETAIYPDIRARIFATAIGKLACKNPAQMLSLSSRILVHVTDLLPGQMMSQTKMVFGQMQKHGKSGAIERDPSNRT